MRGQDQFHVQSVQHALQLVRRQPLRARDLLNRLVQPLLQPAHDGVEPVFGLCWHESSHSKSRG